MRRPRGVGRSDLGFVSLLPSVYCMPTSFGHQVRNMTSRFGVGSTRAPNEQGEETVGGVANSILNESGLIR